MRKLFCMLLLFGVAILVIVTATATLGSTPGPALTKAEVTAFQISKEQNGNLVKYDLKINSDCTIAADDPVSVYWMIQDKPGLYHKKEMNFIENGYYGLSISKKTPHEIDGQIKSLKNRNIDIDLSIHVGAAIKKGAVLRCAVQTVGSGSRLKEPVQVSSIRLEDFHGQIPRQVAVFGKNPSSSQPVRYEISLK